MHDVPGAPETRRDDVLQACPVCLALYGRYMITETAGMRQFKLAVAALKSSDEELQRALGAVAGTEANWDRVRAMQAKAQLHILHAISYDLSDIRGAIENR